MERNPFTGSFPLNIRHPPSPDLTLSLMGLQRIHTDSRVSCFAVTLHSAIEEIADLSLGNDRKK